jgi:hypothetical protein
VPISDQSDLASEKIAYLPLRIGARYMGIAAPSFLFSRLTLAQFRGLLDYLNKTTLQESLICRFLEFSEWTKNHLVRFPWQLMSNKAFHAAKEELWQQVLNQLLRRLPCLFQLMVCGIMSRRISKIHTHWLLLTIVLSLMDH